MLDAPPTGDIAPLGEAPDPDSDPDLEQPGKNPAPEAERVRLHMPVDVRSLSLAVLAVLATLFALRWASAVLIPLMLGLTTSYALTPLVNRLERLRIPRAVGAGLVIAAIFSGMGWTGYALSDDAAEIIEALPDAAQKVRQAVRARRGDSETAMDKVQKAAAQLEQAAQDGASTQAATRGVTRVQIERPRFDIKDYFWSGTLGLVTVLGQATMVFLIAFFLLASGNSFRRKMVKIAGPTFAEKKITVQALDEITEQIQRYLLVQVLVSVVVGVATGLAFAVIGVENAVVWGVVACVLNFIPYIGSLVVMAASALIAFMQFGSVDMALLVAGVSLVVHAITGNLLTPWLASHTSRMNAVTVFVGVLAFGWLWGIWGLLLGVPILMMVKAVCDRVEDFKPIGELLGK